MSIVLSFVSHVRCMCSDPGAVPKTAIPLSDDEEEGDFEVGGNSSAVPFKKFCRKCNVFKPVRAHHCSQCNRCVVKMDHHCPWVNNCVGISNHKLFCLFCFWTCVSCIITFSVILARFTMCLRATTSEEFKEYNEFGIVRQAAHQTEEWKPQTCPTLVTRLFNLFLIVESILFGLFTSCMLADQFTSVSSNTTKISRIKAAKGLGVATKKIDTEEEKAMAEETRFLHPDGALEVNELCGGSSAGRFKVTWLLPVAVRFSQLAKRRIYGYKMSDLHNSDEEDEEDIKDP
jgi:hypothetical protein